MKSEDRCAPKGATSTRLIGDSYQIDPNKLDLLRDLAEETNKSKGALVREAVDALLKKYRGKGYLRK